MTSTKSLFACSVSDVTLDRVRDLVGQGLPESLTVEYKEKFSPNLIKTVAAMANSYGGLIFVGVTDQRSLAGVPEAAVTQIVNACHERLEPPWQPEIVAVRLSDGDDSFIHVIRVDPARAPRPVLIDGSAPIRLLGRNALADRRRLAQLFTESPRPVGRAGRVVPPPELPIDAMGGVTADFMVRSGLRVPVEEMATWRPLSERGVDGLADALNQSPIESVLLKLFKQFGDGFNPFHRLGFNRARHARLVWQGVTDSPHQALRYPVEAIAVADLPAAYGSPTSYLQFTLDVVVRARPFIASKVGLHSGTSVWRLFVSDLYAIMDGLLQSLTDQRVVQALADLAGVDPVIVPQPANLDFLTAPRVGDLLQTGFTPVEDAGPSHGANLVSDPALDMSDPSERRLQVDSWLQQVGLDAGLLGMERRLAEYHQIRQEQSV